LSPGKFGDKRATVCGDAIPIGDGYLYHPCKPWWLIPVSFAQRFKKTKIADCALKSFLSPVNGLSNHFRYLNYGGKGHFFGDGKQKLNKV
jgi:hypothetical protein